MTGLCGLCTSDLDRQASIDLTENKQGTLSFSVVGGFVLGPVERGFGTYVWFSRDQNSVFGPCNKTCVLGPGWPGTMHCVLGPLVCVLGLVYCVLGPPEKAGGGLF